MQKSKSLSLFCSLIALTILLTSCNSFRFSQQQAAAEFTIRVADSTPGSYTVDGTANLPDNTPLNLVALRYLQPGNAASARLNPHPSYSILAYKSIEVQQGEWHSDLNLWRSAPDGRVQEVWQQEQERLGIKFQPDSTVLFLATIAPIEKLAQLEQDLDAQNLVLGEGVVRTARDGLRFAQVDYLISLAPPTGRRTPPASPALEENGIEDRGVEENGGWGKRYLMPQEPQNPTPFEQPSQRQTNAPSRPEEFLQ